MKRECRDLLTLGHGLAEGQLDSGRAAALSMHAAGCPPCNRVLNGARQVLTELQQASGREAPAPPADLTYNIMTRLPVPSSRHRLLMAAGAAAATASAATIFIAALARLMPASGGRSLVPGLSAGLAAAGAWLGRFAALFEFSGGLPLPAGSDLSLASGPSILPALLLIATGLMGLTAVLTLTAARPARPVVPRPLSSS